MMAQRPASSYNRSPASTTPPNRSEEHTSELQSLMRISYAVFCLKKKKTKKQRLKIINNTIQHNTRIYSANTSIYSTMTAKRSKTRVIKVYKVTKRLYTAHKRAL